MAALRFCVRYDNLNPYQAPRGFPHPLDNSRPLPKGEVKNPASPAGRGSEESSGEGLRAAAESQTDAPLFCHVLWRWGPFSDATRVPSPARQLATSSATADLDPKGEVNTLASPNGKVRLLAFQSEVRLIGTVDGDFERMLALIGRNALGWRWWLGRDEDRCWSGTRRRRCRRIVCCG
jgi:hypothetical protein